MNVELTGKRVLITGGTTGVGAATAALLAGEGCRVFICGRDPKRLAATISSVQADGGEIGGVATDLATIEGIQKLFSAADEWLGAPDIVVLNAGLGQNGELTDLTHEQCREVINVNLLSYISCALESINRMRGAGGHIVMIGSMSAEVFDEKAAVYVASKCGVRGFAYSLRKDVNPIGISVSLIEPGSIGTDMVDETLEQQREMQDQMRMLSADDIARSIAFVVSQPKRCDVIKMQVRPHLQIV
ncbi:SDR family oxidoreductase [Luteolibacter sp. Populi]|uniref:SDR family oxidoreductase n=1 Tax=Luteolibacter sp. Populi TaxID=3230487 RepID=UPI003466F33A